MARRRNEGVGMPSTGAGLMRYFDEETSGPKVDPKTIVAMCVGVIAMEIVLWGLYPI